MSTRYSDDTIAVDYSVHRYGAYTVIDGSRSQTYTPKYLTDVQLSYGLGEYGRIKIGANNLFNVAPDENHIGQSRGGKIVDAWGNVVVDSPGVFAYSRRSAPFGFNGGFYYIGWEQTF
jgi:iron complex outermembrane receptor protein